MAPPTRSPRPAAEPACELHNLTADPEERRNRAADGDAPTRSAG